MNEITQRTIKQIVNAQASNDGDGVKIARSVGSREMTDINPFLLLDELRSDDAADYMGGFPSHPHRGFETVTYMLAGQMRHKDSAGNEGIICAGDIQWMTAGSGIIHSEMPEQTQGRLWGFQFWINLPASEKMRAPRYQEIASKNVPELHLPNGKVRVLAGEVMDDSNNTVAGAISDIITAPLLLDVQLNEKQWQTTLPKYHVALIYVYSGEVNVQGVLLKEQQLAVLSAGELLTITASSQPFGALVLAAQAIDEPIARSGPFVMNTQDELQQAYGDYRSGNFVK
jgi:redox-sensitive bicupin YhaK (pirin superfamily)